MNKRLLIRWFQLFGAMALICVLRPGLSHAERVKDMATVAGVRNNQTVGYGLVVGLNGTGDQTTQAPFTVQSISNMLAKFGVTIPASVASQMQLKNVAAVTVTAELPAFVKTGQTIDITVASIANATSLRGGALLMTPLRGADGEVYAMAQGSVMVSGFGVAGKDGSRVSVNVPSGGRIPNGATVEREVPNTFGSQAFVMLNLKSADFTTASRLPDVLNKTLGTGSAQAVDPDQPGHRAPAGVMLWGRTPVLRPASTPACSCGSSDGIHLDRCRLRIQRAGHPHLPSGKSIRRFGIAEHINAAALDERPLRSCFDAFAHALRVRLHGIWILLFSRLILSQRSLYLASLKASFKRKLNCFRSP